VITKKPKRINFIDVPAKGKWAIKGCHAVLLFRSWEDIATLLQEEVVGFHLSSKLNRIQYPL